MKFNDDGDVRVIVIDDVDFYVVLSYHCIRRQYLRELSKEVIFHCIESSFGELLNYIRYGDAITVYDMDMEMSYSAHLSHKGEQFVISTVVPGKMLGKLIKYQDLFMVKEGILQPIDYSEYMAL